MSKIWLIGGTTESVAIAQLLSEHRLNFLVSVTTANGQYLYPNTDYIQVWIGNIDVDDIVSFLQQQQIIAVIDASHPYAIAISQGAIAATTKLNIPYLRYERPNLSHNEANIIYLDSFDALVKGEYLRQQRVLLTIGYKNLALFTPWHDHSTLFARILPQITSLQGAIAAGFTPDRIIALRPPITAELELALCQQWQISLLVTKASGYMGGEDIKRLVTTKLGIPLIIITRPQIIYPQQTYELPRVLEFCCQVSSKRYLR